MCLLYFRWVALLILFCNQFLKDILQVHHSVIQCCCSSKNLQDLVSDMKTFQPQLKRLLFTTCRLGNISSAAYSPANLFPLQLSNYQFKSTHILGPSINRLVTGGNTKLCCRGFVLVLFQSVTTNKIYSEHTKLFPVCKVEYYNLQ